MKEIRNRIHNLQIMADDLANFTKYKDLHLGYKDASSLASVIQTLQRVYDSQVPLPNTTRTVWSAASAEDTDELIDRILADPKAYFDKLREDSRREAEQRVDGIITEAIRKFNTEIKESVNKIIKDFRPANDEPTHDEEWEERMKAKRDRTNKLLAAMMSQPYFAWFTPGGIFRNWEK